MNHPEGQIDIEKVNIAEIRQRYVLSDLMVYAENHLIAIVSGFIAIAFLCATAVNGFSLNAFFGGDAIFVPNRTHNSFDFAYLVTAIGIIITTLLGEKKSISLMQVIGKVYMLVWLIGLMRFGSNSYSEWTSFMNFVLGSFLVVAGSVLQDYRHDLLISKLIAKERHTRNYVIMEKLKNSNFRYSVQRKNFYSGEIYCCEDVSDTSCIRGEFI